MKNTTTFNSIDNQIRTKNNNIADTDTDLEHDTFNDTEELENNTKDLTTMIYETKQADKVLHEKIDSDAAE